MKVAVALCVLFACGLSNANFLSHLWSEVKSSAEDVALKHLTEGTTKDIGKDIIENLKHHAESSIIKTISGHGNPHDGAPKTIKAAVKRRLESVQKAAKRKLESAQKAAKHAMTKLQQKTIRIAKKFHVRLPEDKLKRVTIAPVITSTMAAVVHHKAIKKSSKEGVLRACGFTPMTAHQKRVLKQQLHSLMLATGIRLTQNLRNTFAKLHLRIGFQDISLLSKMILQELRFADRVSSVAKAFVDRNPVTRGLQPPVRSALVLAITRVQRLTAKNFRVELQAALRRSDVAVGPMKLRKLANFLSSRQERSMQEMVNYLRVQRENVLHHLTELAGSDLHLRTAQQRKNFRLFTEAVLDQSAEAILHEVWPESVRIFGSQHLSPAVQHKAAHLFLLQLIHRLIARWPLPLVSADVDYRLGLDGAVSRRNQQTISDQIQRIVKRITGIRRVLVRGFRYPRRHLTVVHLRLRFPVANAAAANRTRDLHVKHLNEAIAKGRVSLIIGGRHYRLFMPHQSSSAWPRARVVGVSAGGAALFLLIIGIFVFLVVRRRRARVLLLSEGRVYDRLSERT